MWAGRRRGGGEGGEDWNSVGVVDGEVVERRGGRCWLVERQCTNVDVDAGWG